MNELLLTLLALPFVIFLPLSRRQGRVLSGSWFDHYIAVVPAMILPYLSFFILVPLALVLLVPTSFGLQYLGALVIGMWAATIVWFFVPSSMDRPSIRGSDVFSRAMRVMYKIDGASNNFPSSHVFVSLISGYYLALAFPAYSTLVWVWALAVAVSTVFVKQHYLLDVVGGVVWAIGSILLATWLIGLL